MMFQPYPPQTGDDETVIFFSSEEIPFEFPNENEAATWLKMVVEQEDCQLLLLNFIFCSDEYLHRLNLEYLQHDTLTDIITFPYADPPNIEGDIFISIDRVRENAQEFGVSFEEELHRVMVHGVLHLCGYKDKSEEDVLLMRKKEDKALALWQFEK